MNANLPEGYTSRPAGMEDLPEIHRLVRKKILHYTGVPGFSLERRMSQYQTPGFDPATNVRLVENENGLLVGLVEVWDDADPPVQPFMWMSVDIDHEDLGLEDYLLGWAEERCRKVFDRVDPELQVAMITEINHKVESARAAFKRHGMAEIRHGFRMEIEMQEAPPLPVWPEGVQLLPFDPETDLRRVFEVDHEVFQDHFGYVKEEPESAYKRYLHHMTGNDSYDPTLWFLASDGGELVGICICRRYASDDNKSGYVSSLGVKRAWRRRGIARALLLHAFGEYYHRGVKKVGLGVDAESLTGALDLYQQVGMRVKRRYDMFQKILRQGKDISVKELDQDPE